MHGGDRGSVLGVSVGPRGVHQAPSLRDQARAGGAADVRDGPGRSRAISIFYCAIFSQTCLAESINSLDDFPLPAARFMTNIAPAVTRVFMSGCGWSGAGDWSWLLGPLATWSLRVSLSPWSPTMWRSVRRKFNSSKVPRINLYGLCLCIIFRENPEMDKQKQNSNVIIDLKTDPKVIQETSVCCTFHWERNLKYSEYYQSENLLPSK